MDIDDAPYVAPELLVPAETARRYSRAIHAATDEAIGPKGVWRASKLALDYRRAVVDRYIQQRCGLTVQSGPFAGMRYPGNATAGSLFSAKILGCYEAELHPYVETLPRYRRFVDVGCAEGYYAVGAKLIAPGLDVHAFDVDEDALTKCREMAALNGVAEALVIADRCTPDTLSALAEPGTIVLVDIEGAELDLLGAVPADRRALCDFIIETHQIGRGGLTLRPLAAMLAQTHEVTVVPQQPRDWAAFPVLQPLGQLDRFLAQWEGRGPDPWIFARAKG